jgi:hypothetical protein
MAKLVIQRVGATVHIKYGLRTNWHEHIGCVDLPGVAKDKATRLDEWSIKKMIIKLLRRKKDLQIGTYRYQVFGGRTSVSMAGRCSETLEITPADIALYLDELNQGALV